jgi:hypothetical protein
MVRDNVERGLNVLGRAQPRLVRPTILESGRPPRKGEERC